MSERLEIKPFLVSSLVERPGMVGHRATVVNADSFEAALGSSLAIWQVDGWSVTSWECVECETVIPNPSKPQ